MKITLLEWGTDPGTADEEAALRRYDATTGWCDALHALAHRVPSAAGAPEPAVNAILPLHRDAVVERRGVHYHFCRDAAGVQASVFGAPARIADLVNRLGTEVLHVNGLRFPVHTWRLRQRLAPATALVVQAHATGDPPAATTAGDQVDRMLRRQVMRAADGFLFTSQAQAGPWIEAGLIEPSQAVSAVAEGSTSLAPLAVNDARRLTGTGGSPAILWVGRLDATHDPLCVLEAFARIRVTRPQASLVMIHAGDDLLPEVRRQAERDPRLRGGVRLLGDVPREHLVRYYSACDVFVSGSRHDSSGQALIEACACGLPPAVTDIPAFRRLTRDGAVGRLWTPGDAHACAVALVALLRVTGPIVRANVRAHFQRALSWPAIARDAAAAYARALEARRQRLRAGSA